jgi:hypothetical protein
MRWRRQSPAAGQCRWAAAWCLLALASAACGGSGASASGASPTPSSGDQSAAFAAYRQCLKDHGVDLPQFGQRRPNPARQSPRPSGQPRPFPSGIDQQKFQEATTACAGKRPAGGFGGGVRNRQAFQPYLSCLKDHGVTVPSPSASRGPGPFQRFDPNDPKFQQANSICAPLRPSPTPPPGGTA